MKRFAVAGAGVVCFLLTGCAPYYIINDFESQTVGHKTVAVLPVEMVYTGLLPEGLTPEDLDEIAVAESRAFQISFYNEILRSTRSGRNPIRVSIQDYARTLQVLEEHQIGIRESWRARPEELAGLLGVDAVVRGRIEKHRLMPDLASFGIEVGVHILQVITDHAFWPWLPFGATKSKEINASYSLMNSRDGQVLWSVSFQEEADWRQSANEIINSISRRGGRKFPYRSK